MPAAAALKATLLHALVESLLLVLVAATPAGGGAQGRGARRERPPGERAPAGEALFAELAQQQQQQQQPQHQQPPERRPAAGLAPLERLKDICAHGASETLLLLAHLALRHSPAAYECVRASLEVNLAMGLCLRYLSYARAPGGGGGGGSGGSSPFGSQSSSGAGTPTSREARTHS